MRGGYQGMVAVKPRSDVAPGHYRATQRHVLCLGNSSHGTGTCHSWRADEGKHALICSGVKLGALGVDPVNPRLGFIVSVLICYIYCVRQLTS